MRRPSTRVVIGVGLLVALLLAGVLSIYASGRPDGLERVAVDQGFAQTAEEHPVEDGPLAGYEFGERGGAAGAGVIGVLVVLVIAGGGAYALRGRDRR